jgi:hypothetical protein
MAPREAEERAALPSNPEVDMEKLVGNFVYEGPSMEEEGANKPFDAHCPYMGSGLNYWQALCDVRQRDPAQKTCFGGCKGPKAQPAVTEEQRKAISSYLAMGTLSIHAISVVVGVADSTVKRQKQKEKTAA